MTSAIRTSGHRATSPDMSVQRQAVTYIRVSTKEQEQEGYSIPAQRQLLRTYADRNNIRVVRSFVEAESACRSGRAQFEAMVRYLQESRSCKVILVEKVDRLTRNIHDFAKLDTLLSDHDVEIHCVKQDFVLSKDSSSSEKFVFTVQTAVAQLHSDNLSEEASKGMLEKARQGFWPSLAPLGYLNEHRPDGRKVIVPDPENGPLVTRAFELYATGNHTLEELTRRMKALGLRFKRSAREVPTSTVSKMLRNPIYMGEFIWKGQRYEGKHEPLVSRETWLLVQQILNERASSHYGKHDNVFAFSQLMKCGHCGMSVSAQRQRGHVYYHCTGYKGKCDEPYAREEKIEEAFLEALEQICLDEETLDLVCSAVSEQAEHERSVNEEQLRSIESELERVQDKLDTMYDDRLQGRITGEMFDRTSSGLLREQERLQLSIEQLTKPADGSLEDGIAALKEVSSAAEMLPMLEAEKKQRFLRPLLSNASWADGELECEFRYPYDLLAAAKVAHENQKAAGASPTALSDIWYPSRDSNREAETNP